MPSEDPTSDVLSDDDDARRIVIARAFHESGALGDWSLAAGEYLIGREEGAAIHLPLPQVSRHHATLTIKPDGTLAIADHGSSSGTRFGGEVIAQTDDLDPPATFQVADVTLEIVRSHESEATLPANPTPPSERKTRPSDEPKGTTDLASLARRQLTENAAAASGVGTAIHDANLERPAELWRS